MINTVLSALLHGSGRLAWLRSEWQAALESVTRAGHEPPGDEAARAVLAWEVAVCWQVEPEHARKLAGKLA